jgi:regulator of protease activity HflC (stomatin/prohibitin superfamily)
MANEFENLGVATQASKFQAEEADIALANTLDTIMQTGGGAGGATALARAALESKRGISADIQKQEKANNDARAEGANQVQQLKAQGEAYKFEAQEQRDVNKMDRLAQQQDNAEAMEAQANSARIQANQQMISAVGSTAQSLTGGMTSLGGVIPQGAPQIG